MRGSEAGQLDHGLYPPGRELFEVRLSMKRSQLSSRYSERPNPSCRRFEVQAARWDFRFAPAREGSSIAAKMAMIAITTSNSINVKPEKRSDSKLLCLPLVRALEHVGLICTNSALGLKKSPAWGGGVFRGLMGPNKPEAFFVRNKGQKVSNLAK